MKLCINVNLFAYNSNSQVGTMGTFLGYSRLRDVHVYTVKTPYNTMLTGHCTCRVMCARNCGSLVFPILVKSSPPQILCHLVPHQRAPPNGSVRCVVMYILFCIHFRYFIVMCMCTYSAYKCRWVRFTSPQCCNHSPNTCIYDLISYVE